MQSSAHKHTHTHSTILNNFDCITPLKGYNWLATTPFAIFHARHSPMQFISVRCSPFLSFLLFFTIIVHTNTVDRLPIIGNSLMLVKFRKSYLYRDFLLIHKVGVSREWENCIPVGKTALLFTRRSESFFSYFLRILLEKCLLFNSMQKTCSYL